MVAVGGSGVPRIESVFRSRFLDISDVSGEGVRDVISDLFLCVEHVGSNKKPAFCSLATTNTAGFFASFEGLFVCVYGCQATGLSQFVGGSSSGETKK